MLHTTLQNKAREEKQKLAAEVVNLWFVPERHSRNAMVEDGVHSLTRLKFSNLCLSEFLSGCCCCRFQRPLFQSSQLVEPLWTDPGVKNEISVRELISTSKKEEEEKEKRRRGMNRRSLLPNLCSEQKATSSQRTKSHQLSETMVC